MFLGGRATISVFNVKRQSGDLKMAFSLAIDSFDVIFPRHKISALVRIHAVWLAIMKSLIREPTLAQRVIPQEMENRKIVI